MPVELEHSGFWLRTRDVGMDDEESSSQNMLAVFLLGWKSAYQFRNYFSSPVSTQQNLNPYTHP